MTQRALITGASRGIGLEFVRQLAERGARVYATCRTPARATGLQQIAERSGGRVCIYELDVADPASIARLRASLHADTDGLDLLINNAGVYPRGEHFGSLDPDLMISILRINSLGPVLVTQALLELLTAGNAPKVINITSQLGSLARKTGGGSYSYSGSKALLNMYTRAMAAELRPMGIIAVPVHPGWVQTDMGGSGAPLTVRESVQALLSLIDHLQMGDSGRYLQWDGSELPW